MGATAAMFVLGSLREILGNGTLFDGADALLGGWAMGDAALAAADRLAAGRDTAFAGAKLRRVRFYFAHVLPLAEAQARVATAGAAATLELEPGERVGLIGRNGAGKSSLLRILGGLESADDGQLQAQQSLRVAFVAQEHELAADATTRVRDQVSHYAKATEDYVHEKPVQSVLIGVAAGAAIATAALLASRKRD